MPSAAEKQLLRAPDVVARAAAPLAADREQQWMLRQPRRVRASFADEVFGREDEEERQEVWMLHQPLAVRESYASEVLAYDPAAPARDGVDAAPGRRGLPVLRAVRPAGRERLTGRYRLRRRRNVSPPASSAAPVSRTAARPKPVNGRPPSSSSGAARPAVGGTVRATRRVTFSLARVRVGAAVAAGWAVPRSTTAGRPTLPASSTARTAT
jgi:hypothetical protein